MPTVKIDLTNLPSITNDKFYPLYANKDRYLVLYGGGSSGKSVFAAQKIIYRMLTEQGHRFLVVRKVGRTLRESCFALLRSTISEWGMQELFNVNKSDLYISCVNGNEILFSGLDDVEKLKSIHKVTSMWIEEASEVTAEDFRQLDIRMRGKSKLYKQIMLTFNPVSVTHWLKSELVDKGKGTIIHSTYKDNKFLDREAIEVLEGFRDTDEYYYQVYCLGQWGVFGKTIFPARIVNERIHEIKDRKPLKRGFFVFEYENEKIIDSTIQWVDDPDGYISIYEEPQVGYPYVLGGDTAGEGSDYFTGHVLNNVTGNQVAVLRNQFDEDLYARQIYCLGKWYNEALVGIEANFSTHPIKELRRLGYPRQFTRKKEDTFTGKITKAYGFQTSKVTRPLVIAALVQVVREHPELINDLPTLNEMLTFVRNEQGRPEAQQGAHDDLIMGLAIAYYIRPQQSYSAEPSNAIYAGGIAPRRFEDDDLDEEELWEIPGFFG